MYVPLLLCVTHQNRNYILQTIKIQKLYSYNCTSTSRHLFENILLYSFSKLSFTSFPDNLDKELPGVRGFFRLCGS